MAYTKNSWKSGDVVTSSKLNHMEDGIADAGGTLVIGGFTYDSNDGRFSGTSDKTWQEIDNALAAGVRCIVIGSTADAHRQMTITVAVHDIDGYKILDDGVFNATAASAAGYPATRDISFG